MHQVTKRLSDFAANLRFEDIPKEAIDLTKLYLADYYAACFAGYRVNDKMNEAMRGILEHMGGTEEASVLFGQRKMPVENAAFLNAVYAHGADMDDGNRKAMGHIAAHVMPAVFALAETLPVRWSEVLVSIHVGYEVYNRIAAAAQPGLLRRGFHSTGTAGSIACGAACAKLMGLDSHGIYHAMAIAAVQSGGLLIITESGQACKPLNPANAARAGILAAKLAARGIDGPIDPLESPKGWFNAMTEQVDDSEIIEGLGTRFTMCESYLKPYPSCRHTHCGIDGALKIRQQMLSKYGSVPVDRIERINILIYPNAVRVAGKIKIPKTADEAKFSIHYSLVCALLNGHYNLEDLNLSDLSKEAAELIEKIFVTECNEMENAKEGIRGAKVELALQDGSRFSEMVLIPKGDAANPLTWDDMKEKMNGCTEGLLNEEQQKGLLDRIMQLNVSELYWPILL